MLSSRFGCMTASMILEFGIFMSNGLTPPVWRLRIDGQDLLSHSRRRFDYEAAGKISNGANFEHSTTHVPFLTQVGRVPGVRPFGLPPQGRHNVNFLCSRQMSRWLMAPRGRHNVPGRGRGLESVSI